MTTVISSTKISPPKLAGALTRKRLFAALDALWSEASLRIVWLGGAPGSGKTILAAGYVQNCAVPSLWLRVDEADNDPAAFFAHLGAAAERAGLVSKTMLPLLAREHFADIPRYARLYFRALFAAISAPCLMVLDDLHVLAKQPVYERILTLLADEATDRVRVLLLSRDPLPEALARLVVNQTVGEMPGKALAFTVEETAALLKTHKRTTGEAKVLHARTRGWAAAIAMHAGFGAAQSLAEIGDGPWRQIAGYLNTEIFSGLSPKEQRGLLALAWLPAIRPGWVADLGVCAATRRCLDGMAANGVLVHTYVSEAGEREYQLHPLFSEFLQERARQLLSGVELRELQRTTARLLEHAGKIEAALSLVLAAEDWPNACELLVSLAPSLLAEARHQTLLGWAAPIPDDARSAWLQFWIGQAEMPSNPASGRENVSKAYEVFKRAADPSPRYRALAAIIATYFLEYSTMAPMSKWLAEFNAMGMDYESLTDDNVKAFTAVGVWSGLFIREPQHPDLPLWESRMQRMLQLPVDPNVKIRGAMLLAKYYWYTGQHHRIWPVAERVAPELSKPGVLPYSRLVWHLLLEYDAWSRADTARGREVARQALAVAEQSGINLIDNHLHLHGASFGLAQGDEDVAEIIDRVTTRHNPARRMEVWHLFVCKSWHASLERNFPAAAEYATVALGAAEAIGPLPQCTALVCLCHALLGKSDERALAVQLRRLHELSLQTGNRFGLYHAHLIAAWLAHEKGDLAVCHSRLRDALVIGRENQLFHYLCAQPRLLANLCAEALAAEIETDYVRELIRHQRLAPPQAMRLDDAWPWPVKIHALGDFAVLVNGKPMASGRKSPRRQLELLQVLIAQNGADISLESLADTLWPDAEGDAALHALETTLYRLRQLIGLDVIRVQAGRISLDLRLCWVDAYALTQLTKQIETRLATHRDTSIGELGERLLALYRGEFLSGNDSPWAIAPRQRLSSGFRRAMTALAEHHRQQGETGVAQDLLQRATKQAAGIMRERRQTIPQSRASIVPI